MLSHISFEARAGEVTAIIGGTGCGKSTLVNLIPRFYDVTGGRVLVDGVDVREQEQDMLHRKIGIVPQKAFLFSGTVADNLRYGKEDATQEEMLHTLEIAQARSFVEKLPNGFTIWCRKARHPSLVRRDKSSRLANCQGAHPSGGVLYF